MQIARNFTERISEWDFSHSWHPFTQMQEYASIPPIHIASGRGGWLTDTEGRAYLDGNASIWTNVHGHNDPDLNAALRDQLDRVAHSTMLGLSHPTGAELAARLALLAPGTLNRAFFSDNGSTAVEIALKISFQYWQLAGQPRRRGVISMAGGYHGDTFGAMAAGDSPAFHGRFKSWCFPASHFPAPECEEIAGETLRVDAGRSLAALRALLEKDGETTACVIFEPSVQGAAGMRLQPPGFTAAVADLCREFGAHLILDEVFVAFGRLGSMLVSKQDGVEPDFLCLAKGISAGYLPLAATLVKEEIYEAFLGTFHSGKAFIHGHTFTGNPLAAAVSLASIAKLEPMIATGEIRRKIDLFGARLREIFGDHPNVGGLRQRGLAAAIDIVPRRGRPDRFNPEERTGLKVCLRARDHRLLLRPLHDSLLLVPPLCLSEDEIDFLVTQTAAAINDTLDARVHCQFFKTQESPATGANNL